VASHNDRLEGMLDNVRAFVREREWESFHDPKNLAMAIASEAGELCAELRWVPSAEADAHCQAPETRQRVLDELADVAICVLMLSDRLGVDLSEAVHDKLARIRDTYPLVP
jgi:dCTP diphosphatase